MSNASIIKVETFPQCTSLSRFNTSIPSFIPDGTPPPLLAYSEDCW